MKSALELENDLRGVIAEIFSLERVWDQNRALNFDHYAPTSAQREENRQRAGRREAASAEIRRLEGVAAGLRREHARARDAELAPRPVIAPPSQASKQLAQVEQNIRDGQSAIENLHARQRDLVVAAATGDKASAKALQDLKIAEAKAVTAIDVALDATEMLERQRAEELREFAERDADSRFAAATKVGEQLTAVASKVDAAMKELATHIGEYDRIARSIRKTGASFDDARMNVLHSVEIRHRAAKSAGLDALLGIHIRDAGPLEKATATLLKFAIKRPEPKGVAA
ncbi:hypothetical protein [Bradyrhizobium sp. USDA 4520]